MLPLKTNQTLILAFKEFKKKNLKLNINKILTGNLRFIHLKWNFV